MNGNIEPLHPMLRALVWLVLIVASWAVLIGCALMVYGVLRTVGEVLSK